MASVMKVLNSSVIAVMTLLLASLLFEVYDCVIEVYVSLCQSKKFFNITLNLYVNCFITKIRSITFICILKYVRNINVRISGINMKSMGQLYKMSEKVLHKYCALCKL